MGMTMTQKILAMHVGREFVEAGDLLVSQVDLILANDITGPPAINEFEKLGVPFLIKIKSRWCRIIFLPARISNPLPCANRCVISPESIILPIILKWDAWASNMRCCRIKAW